jgi:hypothetical protein
LEAVCNTARNRSHESRSLLRDLSPDPHQYPVDGDVRWYLIKHRDKFIIIIIIIIIISGVRLNPLCTAANTGLLYQAQMIDDGDCGAIGGMRFGRGNRSTRRKPTPAPQIPEA